jgi:hypothetical protein
MGATHLSDNEPAPSAPPPLNSRVLPLPLLLYPKSSPRFLPKTPQSFAGTPMRLLTPRSNTVPQRPTTKPPRSSSFQSAPTHSSSLISLPTPPTTIASSRKILLGSKQYRATFSSPRLPPDCSSVLRPTVPKGMAASTTPPRSNRSPQPSLKRHSLLPHEHLSYQSTQSHCSAQL